MKKFLSFFISLCMFISITAGLNLTANAQTEGCYLYSVSDGKATITGYDTSISGDVAIPSTLGGYPVICIDDQAFRYCKSITSVKIADSVTSIGWYAFEYCTGLTSVTIGNGVKSIGRCAFYGCSNLTNITIPDGVTYIGDDAFFDCTSLTSVTIPDSVISIDSYAFNSCTSLTSITIPYSVTSIGYGAFCGCTSLTSINVNSANKNYCSQKGVLFNKNKTKLIQYPVGSTATSYVIPDSVTSIAYRAFGLCKSLTSVIIGNSVKSIGDYAFRECTGLTSITIPDTVKSIGLEAFYGCTNLKDVYYGGNEADWKNIKFSDYNEYFTNATIHYNSVMPAGVKKVSGEWIATNQKNTKVKKLSKAKKSFKATWSKVTGVTGYQVQYATDSKFKKNKKMVTIKKNKTTSTTVKKLKSNKKYYVRIRTYKNVKLNGKTVKVYSKWSSAKAVTVK